MLWEEIVGQEEVIAHLKGAIQSQSLSHAYLFTGTEGIGKFKTALVFAATVNCAQGGCGLCSSCRKFTNGTHPDLLVVEPQGNFILIEQIRDDLIPKSILRPIEARYKIYIIREAESLTIEAANALLKVLEEPPADLIFILVTSHPEKLPPTILSRCQLVKFRPISTSKLQEILIEKAALSEERARVLARLSRGVLGEALKLAGSEEKLERRERIIREIEDLRELDVLETLKRAQSLSGEAKIGLDDLKAEQKKTRDELEDLAVNSSHATHVGKVLDERFKRQISHEEAEGFEEILDIFAFWFRDCLSWKETHSDQLIVNLDKLENLQRFSDGFASDKILSCLEIIEQTRKNTRFNVNTQLALEVMLFGLQEEMGCQ